MGKNIDELLNDDTTEEAPAPEVTEETQEAPEPETDGQPRGPDGKFASKEEKGVEPTEQVEQVEPPSTKSELPQDVYEPLKAIRNENKELKAQLEQQAQQMQAFFAHQQQAQAQAKPKEPEVDFWEDPQAFIQRQFQQFGPQLMTQFQQQQQTSRLEQAEAAFRANHPDFDEKLAAFGKAVATNPALRDEMLSAADPAQFAYERGKTALELQSVGSIDELKAKLRAEWEAEAKAALNPHQPNLPASTATDGSVGARTGPAWSGPKPMNELLG